MAICSVLNALLVVQVDVSWVQCQNCYIS